MSRRPLIVVGFVPAALSALAEFQEPSSVILIEEPDVIRKRDVRAQIAGSEVVRELIEFEYQRLGAADEFFVGHQDLVPRTVTPAVEYATVFAARLAERHGLPGAGSASAQILRDKAVLRRVTSAAGVRNPHSERVASADDVQDFLRRHPGRVVIKPSDRQGAVGTRIIDTPEQVESAWRECIAADEGVMVPDRPMPVRMLAEQCVAGPEYSVEMLVRDGIPLFSNVTAKLLFPGDHPVELAHAVPADVGPELADRLIADTTAVLAAVGFGTGVIHCEWIVDDGMPYLIECAGRFPGDGIVELIEQAYPVGLVRGFYALMSGEDPGPLPKRAARGAAVRFLDHPPGEVASVHGVEEAAALPGVVGCWIALQPGDRAPDVHSSWDRRGSVLTCAESAAAAMRLAEQALLTIRIDIRPE